ncbi:hypothetical protein [Paenibacillus naphthalenovorans]|uniref:Uncharacterized protein n=1 Tax=Paenibacillus naphthalenovorans TaxID=162209 RepID=A0A0U2M3Y9_9BACL|nr:hypothetical protein [Paenibacillus naphthalenovorans]ALS22192.1 hypothetical protein IJ22_18180 [Paenibacillus naphthalenovorans]
MNNIHNEIEQGLKLAMASLSIDRMPTVKELRMLDMKKLEQIISRNGGFLHWARKLDIPQKQIKKKWNDQMVEEEIFNVMKALQIDRMPSRSEIKSVKQDGALHNKICKTLGYRGWAEKLGLEIKDSETKLGQDAEEIAIDLLQSKGFSVERMTAKHPFDLLVNDNVRVDVKSGRAYDLRGSRCHTFGISKKHASCDIYLIFALSEEGELERTFVIPSHKLKVVTLSIGANSMYDIYKDRWDYINTYDKFYQSVI